MNDYTNFTDEQLHAAMVKQQNIQKRCHPDSEEWQAASKVIHAISVENARRYPKDA